jgi:hypothetical protein
MNRIVALTLALLISSSAYAADNAVVVTPGTGVTMKSKDIGLGVQAMQPVPSDTAGVPLATAPGTPNASFALPVQGVTSGTPMPMSAASLPLPTGSATSANQTSQITQETSTATNTGTIAGAITASVAQTNEKQINGVAPLMGNGVSGTGSQRVNIASDNTAFSVNATLGTETTKVIGTVRNVGNVGGVFDAIGQNVAAPANWLQQGCQFNTSPTTITSGNGSPVQCDNAGNVLVNVKAITGQNANGQAVMASSAPITIATDQRVSNASSSVAINVSTATTTQLVALSGSTSIYVTSFDVIAGGTGNITFEYGTGTACATGTTVLTGAYPLVAQAGISKGAGIGAILKVPSGNALCVLTSAAVQMSGSVSYQQF